MLCFMCAVSASQNVNDVSKATNLTSAETVSVETDVDADDVVVPHKKQVFLK